jgi:hypothetical protein
MKFDLPLHNISVEEIKYWTKRANVTAYPVTRLEGLPMESLRTT